MPSGMLLKSEGFASNLYDPASAYTLATFCAEKGLPYRDIGLPVPVETFIAYGQAFQQRFAPNLEAARVTSLTPTDDGFALRLDNGSIARARQVVVASGIREFGYLPPELAPLGPDLVSHSAAYGDLSGFAGREVVVVGGGASAIDVAALLPDQGARVSVIARDSAIRFHTPPRARTLADRIRRPMTGLGPGWRSYLSVHGPLVFHAMPESFRLEVVRRHLGPAPGWFMREQIEGRVPCLTGAQVLAARDKAGRAELDIEIGGGRQTVTADHVIAATGYRVDLGRLGFLGPDLLKTLRLTGTSPALSTRFESSVRGLYFAGASAADSFGPLLRFAFGAGFAARRLCPQLIRTGARV